MNISAAIAVIAVCLAIDAAAITAIASMIASLRKHGDERRGMIVQKASASTLVFAIIYLMIAGVWNIIVAFALNKSFDGINPFSALALVAIYYLLSAHYYKKKYGD